MSDQCLNCTARESILECEAACCDIKYSWYVKRLREVQESMDHQSMTEIAMLEGQLEKAEKWKNRAINKIIKKGFFCKRKSLEECNIEYGEPVCRSCISAYFEAPHE